MSINNHHSSEWPFSPFFQPYYRPYPPIEVTRFQRSAATCINLMEQGRKLLDKVNEDAQFAHELKDAAQKNDHSHVHSLIQAAGVTSSFQVMVTMQESLLPHESVATHLRVCDQ